MFSDDPIKAVINEEAEVTNRARDGLPAPVCFEIFKFDNPVKDKF